MAEKNKNKKVDARIRAKVSLHVWRVKTTHLGFGFRQVLVCSSQTGATGVTCAAFQAQELVSRAGFSFVNAVSVEYVGKLDEVL